MTASNLKGLGYSGPYNDMLSKYLRDNGGTGGDLNTLEYTFLGSKGYTQATLNERRKAYKLSFGIEGLVQEGTYIPQSFKLDFENMASFNSKFTFTRTGSATFIGNDGLRKFSPTNALLNSGVVGAQVGTPGVQPPGWSITNVANGVTRSIVAVDVDANGIPYMDIRFTGLTTATTTLSMDPSTSMQISGAQGQRWAGSVSMALVAGSHPSTTCNLTLHERDSGGAYLNATSTNVRSSLTDTLQRFNVAHVFSNASTAYAMLAVRYENVAVDTDVDVTIRISSPMFTLGTVAPYVPTYGASGTGSPRVDYDPVTLAPRGLLIEESSTNLSSTSGLSVTNVTATRTAIDSFGYGNRAYYVSSDTTASGHFAFTPSTSYTVGLVYTMTVELKADTTNRAQLTFPSGAFNNTNYANFSLTGEGSVLSSSDVVATIKKGVDGFYECSITMTALATATGSAAVIVHIPTDTSGRIPGVAMTTSDTFIVGLIQLEQKAYATSFIPTFGTTVTRGAEGIVANGGWLNPKEGTLFVKALWDKTYPVVQCVAQIDDGTSNNRVFWRRSSADVVNADIYYNATFQALGQPAPPEMPANTTHSGFISYREGGSYCGLNNAIGSNKQVAIPASMTRLSIGSVDSSVWVNGWIKDIVYFPEWLPRTVARDYVV